VPRRCLSAPCEYDAGMSRRYLLLAATSLCVACPGGAAPPSRPAPPDDAALRIRVAQAEARRAGGVAELGRLAAEGTRPERLLALRGLGRIGATGAAGTTGATGEAGGEAPLAILTAALGDPEPGVVGAAAAAIGVAGSLDDGQLAVTEALLAALARGSGAANRAPDVATTGAILEALGRAGSAAAQPALAAVLVDPKLDPKLAEIAGLALGRHGRRKIALAEPARVALVAASASADPAVRYAAVYALAREQDPPVSPAATAALAGRLADPEPEIRAQAIVALGRRKAVAAARALGAGLDDLLLDRDWRVAVEAVRALVDSDGGKDAIAAAIVRRYAELERGDPTAAHVILEGEKLLAGAADRPLVAAALRTLTTGGPAVARVPALTRGWIECRAAVAAVRARPATAPGDPGDLGAVERCQLADHLRLPLVAELIKANAGSLAARRAALARLLAHGDVRVRAAGLGALAALWKAGDADDHRTAITAEVAALASREVLVAGAAVEAAKPLYEAIGTGDHAWLDAAVVARAATERDPEIGSVILELVGTQALAAGAPACRAALGQDPVRAKAAAACLQALGEAPAALGPLTANPPPVDVSTVIGKVLRWRVTTSRGDLVILLHPDVAPWAVATIVALTRKGFYDGLEFHRVVPNFVAQGGDPTESGSGGPGFAIPAEPGALGDGAGYQAGGIGIADAGRDSGGSQWFVMHSRAPHLDGRYTWIGTVESGQKAADALLIGDRVVRAAIEVLP
jgi:cyclophilin family peptidyl-prolyl cis-trans isomerase